MIKRIVKMTFKPENVDKFMEIESSIHHKIVGFKGCNKLTILNDINNPTVFFSYSHWDSEDDLNKYRNSDFFKETWSRVKPIFAEKPEAWSTKIIL